MKMQTASRKQVDIPEEIKIFYLSDLFEIYMVDNMGARIEITTQKHGRTRTDVWHYSFRSQQFILHEVGDWE